MRWEHEQLVARTGTRSGLLVAVAVHSRVLGPAVGGCRLRHYADGAEAIADVLRLSAAMTTKCALAGVAHGGGKSVVAVPAGTPVTPALRRAALDDLGELVASLDGAYGAGPDVGTGPEDMVVLRRWTPHVHCLPPEHGGVGSSSGPTAVGVLAALQAAARRVFGTGAMAGRVVVVVGLGSVGRQIAAVLQDQGARVIGSDVDDGARRFAQERGLGWVDPGEALRVPADVLVPAAVGGVLTAQAVADLDVALVVGPANNQLAEDGVADLLARRGIVWVPDVVASAGGVVATLAREVDGLDEAAATARVEGIGDTVEQLLAAAAAAGTTPLHEAVALADHRLRVAGARAVQRAPAG